MKSTFAILAFVLCSLAIAANGVTVYERLLEDNNYSKLVTAVNQFPTFVSILNSTTSTITLFAPADSALNNVNLTQADIEYHLVNATLDKLMNNQVVLSLHQSAWLNGNYQPLKISIDGSTITVGGATIKKAENATNGFFYGIDAIIAQPASLEAALKDQKLDTLVALLNATNPNLLEALAAANGSTLFAPSNDAFGKLPSYITNYLQSPKGVANQLPVILKSHAAASIHYAWSATPVQAAIPALENGVTLQFAVEPEDVNGTVSISSTANAAVSVYDVITSHGVVHVIDKVLVNVSFSVIDVIIGLGQDYTNFLTALGRSPYYAQMDNVANKFTVFAAQKFDVNNTDDAEYHVVESVVESFFNGQLVDTVYKPANNLGGQAQKVRININNNKTYVNGLEITGKYETTNGVIYTLGSPIPIPGSLDSLVSSTADLSTLNTAVVLANFSGAIAGNGAFTAFAPTNDAFGKLPLAISGFLFLNSSDSNAQLKKVVQYHAAPTINYRSSLVVGETITTFNGGVVRVTNTSDQLSLNDVALFQSVDLLASNGVAHTIDHVLVPTNLEISVNNYLQANIFGTLRQYLNKTNLLNVIAGSDHFTFFAPTDDAFTNVKTDLKAVSNDSLIGLLKKHIVLNVTLSTLTNGTFVAMDGSKLVITQVKTREVAPTDYQINIDGASTPAGRIYAGSSTFGTQTAYFYPINQVLGEADNEKDDDSGLTSTEVGLIVAGCIVAVLLAGAAIGGGVWYYKRRHGYEQIDADSTF